MGYRHVVISDTMVPKESKLPTWFLEKYEGIIDFSGDYWRSYSEYKRYGCLGGFEEDVKKVLQEMKGPHIEYIQLVFFADEGLTCLGHPDVSHVTVTKNSIEETKLMKWSLNQDVNMGH